MRRAYIGLMVAVVLAVPVAAGGVYFTSDFPAGKMAMHKTAKAKPCFIAGNAGYQLSGKTSPSHIVRIDNAAAHPDLRMQLVDDPAAADFVLVDDSDASPACEGASIIESVVVDATALKPDLTVAVSRDAAAYKIYVHSDRYSEDDAAALAAVIRQKAAGRRAQRTATR